MGGASLSCLTAGGLEGKGKGKGKGKPWPGAAKSIKYHGQRVGRSLCGDGEDDSGDDGRGPSVVWCEWDDSDMRYGLATETALC